MPTTPPPSTPTGQVITTTPHTGTWQHPRLDEIVRRQNNTIFDRQNVRRILYNFGGIVILYKWTRKVVEMYCIYLKLEFNQTNCIKIPNAFP